MSFSLANLSFGSFIQSLLNNLEEKQNAGIKRSSKKFADRLLFHLLLLLRLFNI